MDLITLAMAKPKVIDLTKYDIWISTDVGTANLNDFVLGLLYNGGGTGHGKLEGSYSQTFWNDVSSGKQKVFLFDMVGNYSIQLKAETLSEFWEGNTIRAISCSFMMNFQETYVRCTVLFTKPDSNYLVDFACVVEQLTIPGV